MTITVGGLSGEVPASLAAGSYVVSVRSIPRRELEQHRHGPAHGHPDREPDAPRALCR